MSDLHSALAALFTARKQSWHAKDIEEWKAALLAIEECTQEVRLAAYAFWGDEVFAPVFALRPDQAPEGRLDAASVRG